LGQPCSKACSTGSWTSVNVMISFSYSSLETYGGVCQWRCLWTVAYVRNIVWGLIFSRFLLIIQRLASCGGNWWILSLRWTTRSCLTHALGNNLYCNKTISTLIYNILSYRANRRIVAWLHTGAVRFLSSYGSSTRTGT
jgi:hypothetical protein